MKPNRYSNPQILSILRQAEVGVPVSELCREHGMSSASFYKWRAKFGGMDASMIIQMRSIEDENRRLKKMFAELSMHIVEVVSHHFGSIQSLRAFLILQLRPFGRKDLLQFRKLVATAASAKISAPAIPMRLRRRLYRKLYCRIFREELRFQFGIRLDLSERRDLPALPCILKGRDKHVIS